MTQHHLTGTHPRTDQPSGEFRRPVVEFAIGEGVVAGDERDPVRELRGAAQQAAHQIARRCRRVGRTHEHVGGVRHRGSAVVVEQHPLRAGFQHDESGEAQGDEHDPIHLARHELRHAARAACARPVDQMRQQRAADPA